MNYQMSAVGIAIIVAYSIVVLLFLIWPLASALHKLRWRWVLLAPITLVLLAAPWAEEYWIASHFSRACEDAGVHVYKKVEVEGFVDDTSRRDRDGIKTGPWYFDSKSLADWDARGYRFQENMLKDGGVVHLERTSQGIEASILDHPTARYHYKYAYQPTPYKTEERIGWKLEKLEMQVVDSETGEVIARETDYKRYINVAEGSWRLYWGLAKTFCGIRPSEHLPAAALKPVSN